MPLAGGARYAARLLDAPLSLPRPGARLLPDRDPRTPRARGFAGGPRPPPASKPAGAADAPPPNPVKVAADKQAALAKKGAELCAAGEVAEGLAALRAAWAQHEDAELAATLAACEVKASDWPGAATYFAYALRTVSDPEQRKPLEAAFTDVRARVGAVKVTVSIDGADVFVGDDFAGQSPLPGEVYVTPGKTRITAKRTGYGEVDGTVSVQARGTATLKLDLTTEGAVAPTHPFVEHRSATPCVRARRRRAHRRRRGRQPLRGRRDQGRGRRLAAR